jgi:hypothetical protein
VGILTRRKDRKHAATLYPERVTSLIIGGQLAWSVDPRIQAISDERNQKLGEALRARDLETALAMWGANDPSSRDTLLSGNDLDALAAAIDADLGGKPDLDFSRLRRWRTRATERCSCRYSSTRRNKPARSFT